MIAKGTLIQLIEKMPLIVETIAQAWTGCFEEKNGGFLVDEVRTVDTIISVSVYELGSQKVSNIRIFKK